MEAHTERAQHLFKVNFVRGIMFNEEGRIETRARELRDNLLKVFSLENDGALTIVKELYEIFERIYKAGWSVMTDYEARKRELKGHYSTMEGAVTFAFKRGQTWKRFSDLTGRLFI